MLSDIININILHDVHHGIEICIKVNYYIYFMGLSNFGKLSQFLIFEVLVSIQNWLMASLISPNLYWISRFRLSLPLLHDAKICYTKNHSKYVFIMKFCWLLHIYARTYIEICNGYKWNSSSVFLRLTKELWLYISVDGAE